MSPGSTTVPAHLDTRHRDTSPPTEMRVHFVPHWPKNPYQSELARHLAARGVIVCDESRLKEIAARSRRQGTAPDAVHLHALPRFSFLPFPLLRLVAFWSRLQALRSAGTRIVWTIHNVADHESAWPRLDRLLSRRCYRFADALIIHSQCARHLVEHEWSVGDRPNVSVIPHGHFIDCYRYEVSRTEARRFLQLPQDALVFLFLGQIRPYKGVPRLAQTFKTIATPDARLLIAGETLSPELAHQIQGEINADPRISFHPGFLPDNRIQYYMAAADVAVFPYSKALTSGALILAMSFGCACIAPAVGALADTLDTGGGFRYAPEAPDGLRLALLQAVQHRDQLSAMGAHNRARAARWDWDEIARRTASVYRGEAPTDP